MASVASSAAGLVAGIVVGSDKSWTGRMREAAYTSPQGTRIRFDYEEVSREIDKRTTAFDFPGVNDSYVQQNGHSSRRYPFRCIFWGPNHDRIATAFEAALLEHGVGKLEHPLYGTFSVVPFGTITRRDDLKNAANQSIIEVTFWTTVGAIYPSSQANPSSEILTALEGFNVQAAQQFENAMKLKTAVSRANAKATLRGYIKVVSSALKKASEATESVNRKFADIKAEINYGMDVLIGQPLVLARQVVNLVNAPALALGSIASRLEAYRRLGQDIRSAAAATPSRTLEAAGALVQALTTISNDFHSSDLTMSASVSGALLSTINNQFATKPEALLAAEEVAAQMDALVTWRDEGFAAVGTIPELGNYQLDPGTSYQALQQAVALTLGFLIEISFTLVPERRIVLSKERSPHDVAAELYGGANLDERVDFLITSNDLVGEELFEIPRGRVLVYYPG